MGKLITKKTLFMCVLSLFVWMGAKAQTVVPVIEVRLPETVTVEMGAPDYILIADIIPGDATDKYVKWTLEPSPSEAITIDTTGVDKTHCVIHPIGAGKATLTAKTSDGPFTATCEITVVKPVVGMTLDGDQNIEILIGRDSLLKVKIDPFDATNPAVIWESRDSSIVDLISTEENSSTDSVCKILPLKPGTVRIYAKTVEGDFEDFFEITVKSAEIKEFSLNHSIKNDDTLWMYIGEDTTLIAQIRPLEGTYKQVYWTNTNFPAEDIIEIISSGRDTICRIRATGVGVAKIAAETYDGGKRDTCVVKVEAVKIDTMYMKVDTLYLDNKYHTDSLLIATIAPFEATNKSITFTSDNSNIVEVTSVEKDTVCHIRAGYSGETYIYAETFDGRFKDSCYVKVTVPVDSIILRADTLKDDNYDPAEVIKISDGQRTINGINLVTDSVVRLTAVIYPDSATEAACTPLVWYNFDPDLMRIDSIRPESIDTVCYLTARLWGVDTISVTTADGAVSSDLYFISIPFREADSIKINVDGGIVDQDTITLNVKDSCELATTIYPWNASSDTLTWEIIGETDVISVDSVENRVFLSGLKQGDAILYAHATDGSQKKDSFIVRVRTVPVDNMALTKDTVYLYENNVDSVFAVIVPVNATDKAVDWSSSNDGIVAIQAMTDTVCTFKGLKADTAVIRAEINGFKDSCVVIVKEQFLFLESDTTSTNTGLIALSLKLPEDVTLAGSFELQLPKGFGLTLEGVDYRTELEVLYKESSDLTIKRLSELNDSTYIFTIVLKASPANGSSAPEKKKVMDIAYTIYDNDLESSTALYDVKIVNVDFQLSDDTEIREDHTVKIKVFKDETGNEVIEGRNLNVYITDHCLYVNSAKAETVSVYALNGSLLFSKEKPEGQAAFTIHTQEKILIVRGSSGWAQKVFNQ
ncbi:MAG: hypothetical protein LBL07_17660 [Tannerella sp.]|nr:hypothetical protein [Tannerella sp.]